MWPFSRKLQDVLNETKSVRIMGVKFKIKKIDVSNFLDGSKVLMQSYDTYKVGNAKEVKTELNLEKLKAHYRDIFLAAVVEPKLIRSAKPDTKTEEGLPVDNLFTEWTLCQDLYVACMEYTYGKKK